MNDDFFRYDKLVSDALKGVVKKVLSQTAQTGLMGRHHFYITFRTDFPGVIIPLHLRERHPEEMTIVLQHQFWGLELGEEEFEVTLSFNRVNERLVIPFDSITAFADPSAQFLLPFQVDSAQARRKDAKSGPVIQSVSVVETARQEENPVSSTTSEDAETSASEGEDASNVVTLDAFRKK